MSVDYNYLNMEPVGLESIKVQDELIEEFNLSSDFVMFTTDNLDATYQRMLKTMVQDVRALFIKLFDRLDNMRDMEAMPREKQRRISLETLNIYVPIAERLGISQICQ